MLVMCFVEMGGFALAICTDFIICHQSSFRFAAVRVFSSDTCVGVTFQVHLVFVYVVECLSLLTILVLASLPGSFGSFYVVELRSIVSVYAWLLLSPCQLPFPLVSTVQ